MESYIALETDSLASRIFEVTGVRVTPSDIYEIVDSCGVSCEDDLDIERLLKVMPDCKLTNSDGEFDISSMEIGERYIMEELNG